MAIALAREGADIVAARSSQKLEEAVGEVQRLGRKGVAIPVDLTKSSLEALWTSQRNRLSGSLPGV